MKKIMKRSMKRNMIGAYVSVIICTFGFATMLPGCKRRSIIRGSLLSQNPEVQFSFNSNSGDFEVQVSPGLAAAGGELRYLISRNPVDQSVDCNATGEGDWLPGTSRGSVMLNSGQTSYPLLGVGNEIWLQPADSQPENRGFSKLSPAGVAAIESLAPTFVGEACVAGGGTQSQGYTAITENPVGNGAVSMVVASWDGGADIPTGVSGGHYALGLAPAGAASDGSAEMKEYVAACTAELGAIPKLDCFGVGRVVPTASTAENGTVHSLTESDFAKETPTCDKPSALGGPGCNPYSRFAAFTGATVPGVGSANGIKGTGEPTQWAYFCRRYVARPEGSRFFDDVNMIGHNPNTGATCFFNSTLGGGVAVAAADMSGVNPRPPSTIPHPGDDNALTFWIPPYLKDPKFRAVTVESVKCTGCHDNDAFLHTPYVDQVKSLPRGKYSDPASPYYAVMLDQVAVDAAWRPVHLTNPAAGECTSCHRIGSESTCGIFASFSVEPQVSAYRGFLSDHGKAHPWMPPGAGKNTTGKIPDELRSAWGIFEKCCEKRDMAECQWESVPR